MLIALRAAWLFFASTLFIGACTKKSDVTPVQTVEFFFDAVARGDCVDALKWVDGRAKERLKSVPCEEMLHTLQEKRFEAILGAKQDGRDATATMVRVQFAGETVPALIRVQERGGKLRIVSL